MEKVDNMQEQEGNLSIEIANIKRIIKKCYKLLQKSDKDISVLIDSSADLTCPRKDSVSLKICQ